MLKYVMVVVFSIFYYPIKERVDWLLITNNI